MVVLVLILDIHFFFVLLQTSNSINSRLPEMQELLVVFVIVSKSYIYIGKAIETTFLACFIPYIDVQ